MEEFAKSALDTFHLELNAEMLEAFTVYERELLEWNSRFNLTAIRTPDGIRVKHFLDSLSCLPVIQESSCRSLIDVGTGAGFPGIPIKILMPELQLTLVESIGKKAAFCRHIVQVLGLKNVQVINERAEVLGQQAQHRQAYDWAVARAVASLPVLAEFLLPLVRVGGAMLAQKGSSAAQETQQSAKALRLLGGKLRQLIPVVLPGLQEERYLIVVDKVGKTPEQYPRRAGLPSTKPLL